MRDSGRGRGDAGPRVGAAWDRSDCHRCGGRGGRKNLLGSALEGCAYGRFARVDDQIRLGVRLEAVLRTTR